MKKTIYLLTLPVLMVSCLAFANIKGETTKTFDSNKISNNNSVYTPVPLQITQGSAFYTRIHIKSKDGKDFDKITFKLPAGGGSANLGPNEEVGTFIDGVFYNEDAIKKISVQKASTLVIDNSSSRLGKIPAGKNYAIPFIFKTQKATTK